MHMVRPKPQQWNNQMQKLIMYHAIHMLFAHFYFSRVTIVYIIQHSFFTFPYMYHYHDVILGTVKEVARYILRDWSALLMIYTYFVVPSVILFRAHTVLM